MVGDATRELLGRVPLFAELSASELEPIAKVAVPRTLPRGARVFHEGDPGDSCYIVRSGICRVTREHSDGRAITLANLEAGDIFGELAMLDGHTRSASVEALEDSEYVDFSPTDEFNHVIDHIKAQG